MVVSTSFALDLDLSGEEPEMKLIKSGKLKKVLETRDISEEVEEVRGITSTGVTCTYIQSKSHNQPSCIFMNNYTRMVAVISKDKYTILHELKLLENLLHHVSCTLDEDNKKFEPLRIAFEELMTEGVYGHGR